MKYTTKRVIPLSDVVEITLEYFHFILKIEVQVGNSSRGSTEKECLVVSYVYSNNQDVLIFLFYFLFSDRLSLSPVYSSEFLGLCSLPGKKHSLKFAGMFEAEER